MFLFLGIPHRLYRMYGVSELAVDTMSMSLSRKLWGIGTTKRIQKVDTEQISYQREFIGTLPNDRSHRDSALAIKVHRNMSPVRFAQTITPTEAEAVFLALQHSGSWLADHIRPVGTTLI